MNAKDYIEAMVLDPPPTPPERSATSRRRTSSSNEQKEPVNDDTSLLSSLLHGQKSEAVENRIQQCCWGNIQNCSMLSTILFVIVTPDCGIIEAQQFCSILLTTRNNVAQTTLIVASCFQRPVTTHNFCRVCNLEKRISQL